MRIFTSMLAIVLLGSCVSQKKFDELLAERVKIESEKADLEESLNAADEKISKLEEEVSTLNTDLTSNKETLDRTQTELTTLKEEHEQLQTYYNNLLTKSGNLNKDLAEQQERLMTLQANLDKSITENDSLSVNLAQREKKVQELESILEEQRKAVENLKNKISQSLLSFGDEELQVEIKNGKIYVSLAEQLLFKSGSVVVDPKGKDALQQLTGAISDSKDINILVEGHTDDVPIATKAIKDNWDLSVLRATSIVRILVNAGLDENQVTAAGRGEVSPIASNDTSEGRQKNRRTEIIITPDLDELFAMIENQ